jgi:hypothetical protein
LVCLSDSALSAAFARNSSAVNMGSSLRDTRRAVFRSTVPYCLLRTLESVYGDDQVELRRLLRAARIWLAMGRFAG